MAGRLAKRLRIVDDSLGERLSLNIRKTFRSSSYATPINNTGNPNTVETKADHIEPWENRERHDKRRARVCKLACVIRSCVGYLEDSPRIILIVSDAAVAHSSLGHDGRIEPIVGVGTVRRVVAVVSLAAGNELADCGIPSVLLLDLAVSTAPYEQEGSTCNCCSEGDKAHYDACCNCSLIS